MANPKSSSSVSEWYQTERNTEALIKAVMNFRTADSLSGEDIWCLIRLTWITATGSQMVKGHWQKLKVPSLEHLFGSKAEITGDLSATLACMKLPLKVREAASQKTGMVNAYRAYRNSLLKWCIAHQKVLRGLIASAQSLGANDQSRFDLAARIARLPPVPSPTGVRSMAAANHVSPLVACLDPKRRFPIVNGEAGVNRRLAKLGLSEKTLEEKVRGFIGIIGRFGIIDAFDLDTSDVDLIDKIRKRSTATSNGVSLGGKGAALPDLDDAERKAILKSQSVTYRRRHNTMTKNLKTMLPLHELTQGDRQECRFDVLIANYDGSGRDLLIEAKPDPDSGSLRVALGQLFDYRRFLTHQAGTDLAVLTIGSPPESYLELLHDLQITAIWFDSDTCVRLKGDGKAWKALYGQLKPRTS